mgnify:FL=1
MTKQYSAACENNQQPILTVLQSVITEPSLVLEIGSGTGQHAAFFFQSMPHVQWQPTDLPEHFASILAWRSASGADNFCEPLALDLNNCHSRQFSADHVFTANTLHIVSWSLVRRLFETAADILDTGGKLIAYGPFNYGGQYTSASNARFDQWLRERDSNSGIRDVEQLSAEAISNHLQLCDDIAMPANNRVLIFEKN